MPGYIMHMAEAKLIINAIGPDRSPDWKRQFLVGALLPDTKQKGEKITSHFWDPDTIDNLAISPDLNRFLDKYEKDLSNPMVLGYYAHLHLDEQFVKKYWPIMATFYDDEGHVQKKKKDITQVQIMKTGEVIPKEDFFSKNYYYGDYSRLNQYCIDQYDIHLEKEYLKDDECPILEVDLDDLASVFQELHRIMALEDTGLIQQVRVFTKEKLCHFLEDSATQFVHRISEMEGLTW